MLAKGYNVIEDDGTVVVSKRLKIEVGEPRGFMPREIVISFNDKYSSRVYSETTFKRSQLNLENIALGMIDTSIKDCDE